MNSSKFFGVCVAIFVAGIVSLASFGVWKVLHPSPETVKRRELAAKTNEEERNKHVRVLYKSGYDYDVGGYVSVLEVNGKKFLHIYGNSSRIVIPYSEK